MYGSEHECRRQIRNPLGNTITVMLMSMAAGAWLWELMADRQSMKPLLD